MKLGKLTFLLITLTLWFPAIAIAGNVSVRAGSVRVTTSPNGSVYVNTGGSSVYRPASRSYVGVSPTPNRYVRRSVTTSCARGTSVSRQTSTQVTYSGKTATRSQVSSYQCR